MKQKKLSAADASVHSANHSQQTMQLAINAYSNLAPKNPNYNSSSPNFQVK